MSVSLSSKHANTANPLVNMFGKIFMEPDFQTIGMFFNIYLMDKDIWVDFTSEAQEHFSITEL